MINDIYLSKSTMDVRHINLMVLIVLIILAIFILLRLWINQQQYLSTSDCIMILCDGLTNTTHSNKTYL
jgi:hypothetical protein